MRKYFFALLLIASSAHASFVEKFPSLKKFLFAESESSVLLGFGGSPISILRSQVFFSANIFQVQWVKPKFDWEVVSASFGFSMGKEDYSSSQHFIVRTLPRYRITETLSAGPLLGIEYVSYPNLTARFYKTNLFSPSEPFSSSGIIYGVVLSQTFKFEGDYFIKVNEMVYKQTYNTTTTGDGWTYVFDTADIEADRTPIQPSLVFMMEISLLF